MPYKTSFSVITAKIPFLSSPLISLCYNSVNGVSCTRTDISACRDCLIDMPAELADMPTELVDMSVELTGIPIELADMPTEVMWFSVAGFLFAGYFQGRPRPHFIVSSTGSVSSLGAPRVYGGTSNSSGSTVASGSSCSTVASSSSGSTVASSSSSSTGISGLSSLTSWLSLG